MFTVATLRSRGMAASMYPLAVAPVVLSLATIDGVTWTMVAQGSVTLLCAWGLGDATRRWAMAAQEAATESERAVVRERTRMARELHDVVSHHMAVVALQTGVASNVLDTDQEAARTAIDHAGDAGREALQDLGRVVEALRGDEGPAGSRDPQPRLVEVDVLVRRMHDAGLDVRLSRSGTVRGVGLGVELCAYRVIQESLTNTLKHAGAESRITVDIAYGDDALTVRVQDDGGRNFPKA